MKPTLTLITGGARSGKSSQALRLAQGSPKKAFLATAEALDQEMAHRIQKHQEERGQSFFTQEEPLYLAQALAELGQKHDLVLVDCITVWLGNLMHHQSQGRVKADQEIQALLRLLEHPPCQILLVTNELGMGLVPADALSREFRDLAGWTNQKLAALADRVIFCVSGLAMNLKEPR